MCSGSHLHLASCPHVLLLLQGHCCFVEVDAGFAIYNKNIYKNERKYEYFLLIVDSFTFRTLLS